jgi:hypothetical protein
VPWTNDDHAQAVAAVEAALDARQAAGLEVDRSRRAVESMAVENHGADTIPTGPTAYGARLERRLTSGRYGRWATIVWRCRLADNLARAIARRQVYANPSGDVLAALERAGVITKAEANRRAQALRDGTARPIRGR